MKKYITIIVSVLALMTSCHDLSPKIYDKISPENFPSNQEDVKTMVTGVYGEMNGVWTGLGDVTWQSRLIMNTATTDEFICYWGGSVWDTYRYFLWVPTETHVVAKTYIPYVQMITKSVNALYMMEKINMDVDLKARYKAELEAIIALYAYMLYDFYGAVPIVLDPKITMDPNTEFIPERPTKEWMLETINTYARNAANVLPIVYSAQSDYGRMTKGTALMVMLKLAMHEKQWQKAIDLANEIKNLDHYKLQSSYISVFAVENEMNNEIILPTPNIVAGGRNNDWLAHVLPSAYVEPNGIPVTPWGGYKVPWDMYDKYWDQVGPITANNPDERLQSIWHKVHIGKGEYLNLRESDEDWAKMGAIPYKYPADPSGTGTAHGNDYIIYRYADVILLKAEAINKLRPLDGEAIQLINDIRGRAKTTLIQASDFTNGDKLNDFILDERFRELFMEGTRREDLIRHGRYLEKAKERGASEAFANEYRLLFPLPQSVINQSKGKVAQNPGY